MRTTLKNILLPAVGGLALMNTAALGNDAANLLENPGFEAQNPAFPALPIGWNAINMDSNDYVDIGDSGAFVRTGNRSIRLKPASGESTRFRGLTTNLFRPDGSDLYDPDYLYLGGDVTVSGYYLVPDGQEIQDTVVGVKLEFRREPPNFSIWGAFEFAFPSTTTGGDWMPFSFVVTDEMILTVGDFPPEPTSLSVLPFRFFGGEFGEGTSPTGEVFIDDLCVVQNMGGDECNGADLAEPFGELDFFDISAFLSAYAAQDAAADLNNDSAWDFFDISAFLTLYGDGCP